MTKLERIVPTTDGQFIVVDESGATVAGPMSHAAAWAWVDDHTREGLADRDRHNRIRTAFSDY